mmetsp:Transcript_73768/g.216160  ORF Transcript_73768/g.216160 Transcript_73768/m.216160 type:complete len:411 (-) Transcript_73768:89-1321(-)
MGGEGPESVWDQPCDLPKGEPLWPIREDQKPEVVHTVEEFLEAALFQSHVDRVVVLPNGVNLLRQHDGIPECLCKALHGSQGMRDFLNRLDQQTKESMRGRLWHYGCTGKEKEVKVKGPAKKALAEILRAGFDADDPLVPDGAPLYVSELRWREKVRHPLAQDEMVKTATQRDIYDATPLARGMPLWERSEGGIFVGERGAGSGLHVDQCLWSNVGRNWCGFKLFAVWPWTERHDIVNEAGKGRVFHLPLSQEDTGFLSRAKVLAMVGPGDAWVFSGAQPHTALIVGNGVNVSAYESLVPANPTALGTLVRTNTKESHIESCWMDDDDLDELYEDVVDNLQRSLRDPSTDARLRQRLEDCVRTMREKGDAYCKKLWVQEERGERRRQREEEEEEEESDRGKKARSEPSSC